MLVDEQLVAEDLRRTGILQTDGAVPYSNPTATVSIAVDKTFSAPGDRRNLGVIVIGVGFR